MAGQNVPLMLTQGITVTNDSLVHFMPDTTPRAAKKVYLVFLSLSAVWTLGVWGAAGELIQDLRSKASLFCLVVLDRSRNTVHKTSNKIRLLKLSSFVLKIQRLFLLNDV